MTVIAAIRKNDEIWLGADSFYGSEYTQSSGTKDLSKIVEFKNFSVAIAGRTNLRDALETLKTSKPNLKIKNKREARDFACILFSYLKDFYEQGFVKDKEEEGQYSSFIIATKDNIFRIYSDLACWEFDQYTSAGAGELQCQAVLEALYSLFSAEEVIRRSMETACALVPMCSLPLDIRRIK